MPDRPSRLHVFIIDGTLSRLAAGRETNAGQIYKLLGELGNTVHQTVGYDPGVQGEGLSKWITIASGNTINTSIMAGYAALASRYAQGDQIMLFGYSRGAYAARSLAGFIGRVGLLRRRHAAQRRIQRAFRHYTAAASSPAATRFSAAFCHRNVPIEMIGCFDTVAALGLPYPLLSRLAPMATHFHDHRLGPDVRRAAHALALDETRTAYAPVMWDRDDTAPGILEQVWFPGAHADVGGQVGAYLAARPLSNIPLMWMLDRAEACGLTLPEGWRDRVATDPAAPHHGCWRGTSRLFLVRGRRDAGTDPSERLHDSVQARRDRTPKYKPRADWQGPRRWPAAVS